MVDVSIGFSSCTSSMEAAQPSVLSGAGREQPPIADQYSGLFNDITLLSDNHLRELLIQYNPIHLIPLVTLFRQGTVFEEKIDVS